MKTVLKSENILRDPNGREIIWVCVHCGRWANEMLEISDASCMLNALPFYKDKCRFYKNRVVETEKGGSVERTCPDCMAHYHGFHKCDGLMKLLVKKGNEKK